MRLTFVGTGAVDWDWSAFPPGTRGSTATLVNGACLIDAGPTVIDGLARCGADAAQIADVVITHSHGDHLHPETLAALAAARGGRLTVWASPEALAALEGVPCERRELRPGLRFACGDLAFRALPSNHATQNADEETFHYFIEGSGATLLYALDGAWMRTRARTLLADALGGRALDAVVWDATCGGTLHDWRFAEHNDLAMVDALRAALRGAGLVSEETVHVFDHVARTLWPATPEERATLAASYGGLLAEDGLTLDIGG